MKTYATLFAKSIIAKQSQFVHLLFRLSLIFAASNCLAVDYQPNSWYMIATPDEQPILVGDIGENIGADGTYSQDWIVFLFEAGEYRIAEPDEYLMPWSGAWFLHTSAASIEIPVLSSDSPRTSADIGQQALPTGWSLIGVPAGSASVSTSGIRVNLANASTGCQIDCFFNSVDDPALSVPGFISFAFNVDEGRYEVVEDIGLFSSSTGLWFYSSAAADLASLSYYTKTDRILADATDIDSNNVPDYIDEFVATLDLSDDEKSQLSVYAVDFATVLSADTQEIVGALNKHLQHRKCIRDANSVDLISAASTISEALLRTVSTRLLYRDIQIAANRQAVSEQNGAFEC